MAKINLKKYIYWWWLVRDSVCSNKFFRKIFPGIRLRCRITPGAFLWRVKRPLMLIVSSFGVICIASRQKFFDDMYIYIHIYLSNKNPYWFFFYLFILSIQCLTMSIVDWIYYFHFSLFMVKDIYCNIVDVARSRSSNFYKFFLTSDIYFFKSHRILCVSSLHIICI